MFGLPARDRGLSRRQRAIDCVRPMLSVDRREYGRSGFSSVGDPQMALTRTVTSIDGRRVAESQHADESEPERAFDLRSPAPAGSLPGMPGTLSLCEVVDFDGNQGRAPADPRDAYAVVSDRTNDSGDGRSVAVIVERELVVVDEVPAE